MNWEEPGGQRGPLHSRARRMLPEGSHIRINVTLLSITIHGSYISAPYTSLSLMGESVIKTFPMVSLAL